MLLGFALAGIMWTGLNCSTGRDEPIGLFTSMPIMWSGSGELADELRSDTAPHWALALLRQRGKLVAIDGLGGDGAASPLTRLRRLVIAQPRPLAPQENLALDRWVRGGGQVLLLVDPALTEASAFALGDPRWPADTAMLSPILAHWGLGLEFNTSQDEGREEAEILGVNTPIDRPGHFITHGQGNCRLWSEGLAVTCAIGKGRLVALADAAVLARSDERGAGRRAFAALLDTAFVAR